MLYTALSLLTGICVFQLLPGLPARSAAWLGLLLPLALFSHRGARLAAYMAAGFLWAWWNAAQLIALRLPEAMEGQDLYVEGRVESASETLTDGGKRFRFNISRYRDQAGWHAFELPVLLNWYRQSPPLQAGERWSLRVRLKQPHGFANPGGFDYPRWLFAQRLRASGYVRPGEFNRRLTSESANGLATLRARLARELEQRSPDPAGSALIKALILGMREGISDASWEVLRRTGTSHLIAISGLHVGLVAGLAFLLIRRSWAQLGLATYWPAPAAGAVAAMLAALAYALLSGYAVPAQRATIMVWVWMLARLAGRSPGPWQVWSLALFLVLLRDPLTVLTPGFWLSFGAVAWIFYLGVGRRGQVSGWRRLPGLQSALVLGLTPLLWLCFGRLSLIAPLANLFAIPWIGLLVVPLLLFALPWILLLPPVADLLLALADRLLDGLWILLELLAALPGSEVAPAAVPLPILGLFAAGLCCVLAARALPLRLPGLLLLLPALFYQPARPQAGDVWLTLLDVGQGLAAVVETQHHVLVYDTGPAYPSGFNTGDAVLIPFLNHRGYRHVNRMIISHADIDHRGGGPALINALDVYSVHSGEANTLDWARASRCRGGTGWHWDGVRFDYLPTSDHYVGNNASCVLRIETAAGRVVLLPGDIEREVERELLQTAPGRLAAQVLVVPHHGSRTSSTGAFVDAVRPRHALFATGYRNRFGFPSATVTARYRAAGASILDTARLGAIDIRLEGGKPLRVSSQRSRARRYRN